MASSCRSVPSHTTKMSSMNLFQRRGFDRFVFEERSSSFAIKRGGSTVCLGFVCVFVRVSCVVLCRSPAFCV